MANIQTFIVESRTPELAICARWRANAFSVLQASFERAPAAVDWIFPLRHRSGWATSERARNTEWLSHEWRGGSLRS
jgi:hypothetical protein